MEQAWFVAALWPLVAVVAGLIANWLKISTALSEIVVGTVTQLAIGALAGGEALGAKAHWITFLAGTGAIRPEVSCGGRTRSERLPKLKWKESTAVGWLPSSAFSRGRFGGTQCTRLGLASKAACWRNRFEDFGSRWSTQSCWS